MATVLVAFFCLVLVSSSEAPAQTAPWDIENIQYRLVDLGYDVGYVDGLLGPRTRAALRAFQADQGLPITGLPDGDTQRALFATEPPASVTRVRTPADDPPSLEAVPLEPVRVEPLAPLVGVGPHEGRATELSPGEEFAETRPPVRKDRDWTLSQGYAAEKSELRDRWIKWVAGSLAVLGALFFFAAVSLKLAKRKTVDAEQAQPIPAAKSTTTATATTTTTTTTSYGGHVFGVDVPPSGDSGSG